MSIWKQQGAGSVCGGIFPFYFKLLAVRDLNRVNCSILLTSESPSITTTQVVLEKLSITGKCCDSQKDVNWEFLSHQLYKLRYNPPCWHSQALPCFFPWFWAPSVSHAESLQRPVYKLLLLPPHLSLCYFSSIGLFQGRCLLYHQVQSFHKKLWTLPSLF